MSSVDGDVKMRILLAARKLFAKQGFDRTTVRQICEEANANIALVSYYFGGKENMFEAMLDVFFPNNDISGLDPDMDPVEGVKLIIREVSRFRRQQSELVAIIQQEILLETKRIDKIRQYAAPLWIQLREWLRAGRERGQFRFRSLDATFSFIVGSLIIVQERTYWRSMMEEAVPSEESYIEDATNHILRALGAAEAE
ncbi:TetR/AcrR family transcriptional regulator [Paenibacillus thailandensis]|uniref:TetR/AcrR family transcriptional regulator n=1 Tax=Paenibacillus thailandensis TaxID=393250 RepID=A0ABW5QVJ6_9BACL